MKNKNTIIDTAKQATKIKCEATANLVIFLTGGFENAVKFILKIAKNLIVGIVENNNTKLLLKTEIL